MAGRADMPGLATAVIDGQLAVRVRDGSWRSVPPHSTPERIYALMDRLAGYGRRRRAAEAWQRGQGAWPTR